jgi:DNA-binding beta-propeller fold protein YncE
VPAGETSGGDWQVLIQTENRINDPQGIAVDRQGSIYISDRSPDRVLKLSPQGEQCIVCGPGSRPGQVDTPRGLALDRQGNLYVADFGNHRVQKLAPDGTPLLQWSAPEASDVAIDASGQVYLTGETIAYTPKEPIPTGT